MIAAGASKHRLGVMLLRLRTEFDSARGAQRLAELSLQKRERAALDESRTKPTKGDETDHKAAAKAMRDEAALTAKSEFAYILAQLKTLREARDALGRHACIQATKQRFMRNDREVGALVSQVLQTFLDPLCHVCGGTGVFGSAYRSEKPELCRECKGTKQRRAGIGKDAEQQRFGQFLLTEIESMIADASGEMSRMLRNGEE
jgi:hypothetical protein